MKEIYIIVVIGLSYLLSYCFNKHLIKKETNLNNKIRTEISDLTIMSFVVEIFIGIISLIKLGLL